MTNVPLSVFRRDDIRGVRDTEITPEFTESLGRGLVAAFNSKEVVIGYDARPSSIEFSHYLAEGIAKQGANVLNLGMVPTELVPITAALRHINEAVIITASHNPPQYIGFKLSTNHGAMAINQNNCPDELAKIKQWIEKPHDLPASPQTGTTTDYDAWPEYTKHIFTLVPPERLQLKLSMLAEAGNGMGGVLVNNLIKDLPINLKPLLFEPDGTYPSHTPNPLLPDARLVAETEAKRHRYDLTVMFDGDADRAAFLDENGAFVPADYFGTLIMDHIIHPQYPESAVITDYRRGSVLEYAGKLHGYTVIRSKAGYSYVKRAMQDHNVDYAFEASGHIMYKDTFYSESSGLTLLYILKIMNETGKSLVELLAPYRDYVKLLDETNYIIGDKEKAIADVAEHYKAGKLSYPDGLVIEFPDWRANIRASGTEPLLRLTIEAFTDAALEKQYNEIDALLKQLGARLNSSH